MANRVYISGQITGTTDYLERFREAEKTLVVAGYSVINPAEFSSALPHDLEHGEYMQICFALLDLCESIYMLHGWEKSSGANREYGYAVAEGKKILLEDEAINREGGPENGQEQQTD